MTAAARSQFAAAGRRRFAANDPFYSDVFSLLQFEGADASTTITDQKSRTWTAFADAQIDTAITKFPGGSLRLDGTGDYIADGGAVADWQFLNNGLQDWTLEGWIYLSSLGAARYILTTGASTAVDGVSLLVTSGNALQFTWSKASVGNYAVNLSTGTLAATTWYYYGVVYEQAAAAGQKCRLYFNSATVGAQADPNGPRSVNPNAVMNIGRAESGSNHWVGYFDSMRITKRARTIVVPSAAFPNS